MQGLGLLIGLVGLVMLIVYPAAGVGLLVLGGLFAIVGAHSTRREEEKDRLALEERRHQELLAAMYVQK